MPATIYEIGVFNTAATAGEFAISRASTAQSGSTSVVGVGRLSPSATSVTNLDTAWSTAPSIGTVKMREFSLSATIGAGVIFTYANGLIVPESGNLLISTLSAVGVVNVYFVWDE
jgi:hypothetical protein